MNHKGQFQAIVFLMNIIENKKVTTKQLKSVAGVQATASSYAVNNYATKQDLLSALDLISETFKNSLRACRQGYDIYNRRGDYVRTIFISDFISTLSDICDISMGEITEHLKNNIGKK